MQVAVRPRFAAGVALVGASVIAASTVAPMPDVHLPDVHLPAIRTIDVGLAAAVNPLEVYGKVFQNALANAGTLAENTVPGQVLKQILANQVSSANTIGAALGVTGGKVATAVTTQIPQLLQTALTELGAGNVEGASNALLQIPLVLALPALDLLPALTTVLSKPLENLVNVMKAFTADTLGTQLLVSGLIAPLISTPAAAAVAMQNVLSAVMAGDPMAVVNAIVTAPATIVDGFLNGGYVPDLAPLVGVTGIIVKAGGLLSSPDVIFGPDGSLTIGTGGPFAALQQILQKITTAITPPAPSAVQIAATDVAAIPTADATTVSLAAPASTQVKTTAPTETAADAGATETAERTPEEAAEAAPEDATEDAGDTIADPTDEPATAPVSTPDESTGDTESGTPTEDSASTTPKDDSADASDGKTSSDTKPSTGTKTPSDTKTPTGKDSTDATAGKTPTGKDADVKTGNKVEPKTTAGSHSTKSGTAAASHGADAEQSGSSADATADTGANKDGSTTSDS